MKKSAFFVIFFMLAGCANAADAWLTVVGDAARADVTTIQVNPTPLAISGDQRIMQVRVNRSVQRTTRDGVIFRSFSARVVFDCVQNTAFYVSADFYSQPLWKGEISKSAAYAQRDPRSMEFREVEPNPRGRIVRAACQTGLPSN